MRSGCDVRVRCVHVRRRDRVVQRNLRHARIQSEQLRRLRELLRRRRDVLGRFVRLRRRFRVVRYVVRERF